MQSSPFGPSSEYAEMELLFPSMDQYVSSEISRVVFGAVVVVGALLTGAVLSFSLRGSQLVEPWLVLTVAVVLVAAIRYPLGRYIIRVNLFYDRKNSSIIWLKKGALNTRRISADVSQIDHVEFRTITAPNGRSSWAVALKMKDGSLHTVPGGRDRLQIKQSAERTARAAGVKMISTGDKELATEDGEPGYAREPLYKRIESPEQPSVKQEGLLITQEKIDGGQRYSIGIPYWVTGAILGFAAANLGLGILIWFKMSMESARWASIPFLLNTFIVFIAAAMLNSYRRSVEITRDGVRYRESLIPLDRLMDIDLYYGVVCRFRISSEDSHITLWLTEKQASWLRSEIKYQLWSRRAHIDKSL
ncbi:MAG: hypothetical protein ACE5EN_09610 [Nitrospinota bacterium]